MDRKVKAAALSVASNSVLVVMKFGVGITTGSVGVISEAAHSSLDLFAAVIAFFSVKASGIPPDEKHPYGHGKIENVSGVIEALLIFIAAIWIIFEAIHKFHHLSDVQDPLWGVLVMGISVVVNIIVSKHLFKVAKETDSIALETDAHHLSTDVWTSLGVFAGLLVIQIFDLHIMDPIIALAVALMISYVAIQLTIKAFQPLLDVTLPDCEVSKLKEIVLSYPKVVGFHKMRTRKSGPYRHVDYHLIVPAYMPICEAHDIAETIENEIKEVFPNTCIVTHVEPDTEEAFKDPNTYLVANDGCKD